MSQERQAIFLADLGFGDGGKGTITDFLTRRHEVHTIVRYNGGPQAAHNVVTDDGRHHTFAQFGSGMFLPWTSTLLSRFTLINPLNMLKEERHLHELGVVNVLGRTKIDRRALVITPFHQALNRLREIARAGNRHGSCGEGIGECMSDSLACGDMALLAGDLEDRATVLKKLALLRERKRRELADLDALLPDTEIVRQERAVITSTRTITDCADVYQYLAGRVAIVDDADIQALLARSGTILFEGAQGVLLDENYGFAPYTTWSTTTFANAETFVQEQGYSGEITRLGVLRTYATRHGSGPFPTEDRALTPALPESYNAWNAWQHTFRVGHLDLVAARYALDVLGKLDYLALTHLDCWERLPKWQLCVAYRSQERRADLSTYFELAADRVSRITVRRPADLEYQENLTQRLLQCVPEYLTCVSQPREQSSQEAREAYLSLIEERLGVPIALTSAGPAAAHKRCLREICQPVMARI